MFESDGAYINLSESQSVCVSATALIFSWWDHDPIKPYRAYKSSGSLSFYYLDLKFWNNLLKKKIRKASSITIFKCILIYRLFSEINLVWILCNASSTMFDCAMLIYFSVFILMYFKDLFYSNIT